MMKRRMISLNDIKGRTLEERAQLVLQTDGASAHGLRRAYRKMARRYHPDVDGGDTRSFQVINEAYGLLARGELPRHPLLEEDDLIMQVLGEPVEPLHGAAAREAYNKWHRLHFFWDW